MSNRQADDTSQPTENSLLLFQASAADFKKIPGNPISYWVSQRAVTLFASGRYLSDISSPRQGLATSDDQRFLRLWHEVSINDCALTTSEDNKEDRALKKWIPFVKGGAVRRWYGNNEFIINWENDGSEVKEHAESLYGSVTRTIKNMQFYFKEMIAWSLISSGMPSFRWQNSGQIFGHKGPGLFSTSNLDLRNAIGFLNSKVTSYLLSFTSQSLSYEVGAIQKLPVLEALPEVDSITLIDIAARDWDSYESSWDFSNLPLLDTDFWQPSLYRTYQKFRSHWHKRTQEMQCLEEENNRIFIDAYGLQDELTSDVPLNEITLTCNPHYRYGNDKSEEELEALLLADTMRELISYAVGCMFGRYSLDEPGLILANQGETIEDYLKQIPEPSFMPDAQNVIPMMEGEWFTDNINIRFREFLRTTFGEAHFKENLAFVEQALGKDIRKYFLRDFYSDHVRRYKKRPIYWLFSSPKGSFNALIYMHRYQPHTVGTVLEYLRDFKDEKLKARKDHLEAVSISAGTSQGDKTRALKEIEKINKILAELDDYERDVLYPLATEQVEIDLDDGVKANYPKFGEALKKIPGLS
ncbi:BREX-1 system adenine-specific DNA-methyltransferase PglX [Ectothiorhodospira sp. 9100]|nr:MULTISPECIES: BREX-1 system adenine-specific DNA-methyltransferase PglX [unclassified Ectothiorhodospira]MCG5516253.1 BREX-1 system adenine-specific DNA-methyltransferase PglX [Ectothiorhodospira sp. 9100]MCG5518074.1 BREX-1 system adenine-specific DNA-methyltransferase PglX [Ectothiorhodospira sp. 9905]